MQEFWAEMKTAPPATVQQEGLGRPHYQEGSARDRRGFHKQSLHGPYQPYAPRSPRTYGTRELAYGKLRDALIEGGVYLES